jgi:predicted GNAT family acetyltransferase
MNWTFADGRIIGTNEKGEVMAETTYVYTDNGAVDIDHTYVNPLLRGQGVADKMMTVVANHLREKGLKAAASCSYANLWLRKNEKDYADIISEALSGQSLACRIDGIH